MSESTKASPFSLIYGTVATSELDLCLPKVTENVPKTIEHAYKYWFDNLTSLRKLARENMICSKQKQKIQYDRHTSPISNVHRDTSSVDYITITYNYNH